MKRFVICLAIASGLLALASVLPAPSLAGLPVPQVGSFSETDLEAARIRSQQAPPSMPGWEGVPHQDEITAESAPGMRLNGDNDTAHYVRGTSLVIHIFVDHTGGSWNSSERDNAAATTRVAKNWLRETAPYGANLHFDCDGTNDYWYYAASLPYNIPHDGFTYGMINEILTSWGFTDADGDNAIVDDFTLFLQNWGGGWDNVLTVWEPRQTGRSWAGLGLAYCILYYGQAAGVFAHEWGHIYGACDEYVEGGHCMGGVDCGECRNHYLYDLTQNGNCALAGCPMNVPCVMRYNTFDVCAYTHEVWAWDDTDGDGILDNAKRRTSGNNFVAIYEVPHRVAWFWNNVNDGYAISQRWNRWAAVGLRVPYNADYDIALYGDNNHNFFYASSALGTGSLDFIVGDYNHSSVGNEHLDVTHYSGGWDNYELFFDSDDDLVFADGIEREEYWHPLQVVRVYDLPLFAGEKVSFLLTPESGNLDLGMALFRSNGSPYWTGRSGAQWDVDSNGLNEIESFTWTVPADDVYGLVLYSKVESGGDYALRIGGIAYTLAEESPVTTGGDLQLYNYDPNSIYWSFVGCKPQSGTDARLSLFADANYQTHLEDASDMGAGGMEFLAVDYNHAPTDRDHIRMVRTAGGGNHTIEWEHDNDVLYAPQAGWWNSGYLGKVWDADLRGGRPYFLRQYHAPGSSMDTGIYLFSSTDGDAYKSKAEASVASDTHPAGDGGEWFAFVPPLDDWYGVYFTVLGGADSYSLWLGPLVSSSEGYTAQLPEPVIFDQANVSWNYWTVFAARGEGGAEASTWLYGDPAYSSTSFLADDQSDRPVVYVVGDYNHNPTGMCYPRHLRGGGAYMSFQWESGPDQVVFTPGSTNTYNMAWPQGDIAGMWDVYINGGISGGEDVRFIVSDLSGTNDFGIAFFASNGAPYYGNYLNAVAQSDGSGAGGSEEIAVHLTRDDWYGLLIYSKFPAAGGNYRVQVIDPAGGAVDDGRPAEFAVRARTANPFDASVTIEYSLPWDAGARLSIFDIQGREVRRLVDAATPQGVHAAVWDGNGPDGKRAANGIYFAKLSAGGKESAVRIIRQ